MSVHAQNNVFVLVDVSKSIKQVDLTSAKQALNEILLGNTPSNSNIVGGSLQDLAQFKIKVSDKISVVKFGNQQTTLSISPNPVSVTNLPTDIYNALNSFPTIPTDNNTYYTLAKAKIAEYAKRNNISKYMLCIISDENEDDFGPGGKPNYQSPYIQELVDNYDTKTNPASANPAILVKLNTSSHDFKLRFISSVDVSNYNIPGGNTTPTSPVTITAAPAPSITLTSFPDGKKNKPKPTKSNSFTVTWNCNCPTGTIFNVQLSELGGSNHIDPKKNITTNSVKFTDVPSGKFKIVVSAANANPAITFVETPAGSFGLVIFLIIILIGGGIGYYLWNKKRQEKIDVFASNKGDDIFSRGNNNGSTNNSSSNSDYF
jgi:uncharacterized membrane protein